MKSSSPMLGDQLAEACLSKQNAMVILPILENIQKLIRDTWKRKQLRGDIATRAMCIGDCFPKDGDPDNASTLKGYYLFVGWMIDRLKSGHDEQLFDRLLFDFVCDFGSLGFVSNFTKYKEPRRYTTDVSEMFKDVSQLYLVNRTSFGLTNEILAIFGLRQCLENRLKTIIGIRDIQPRAKIKTEAWFRIVKKAESQMSFAEDAHCSLDDVERIYEWTNRSIHGMTSYCCWQVWKAFDCCRFLFTVESDFNFVIQNGVNAEADNPWGYVVSCPAHDAVRVPFESLCLMRDSIVNTIQKQVNRDKKARTITWDCPQAHIIGEPKKPFEVLSQTVLDPKSPIKHTFQTVWRMLTQIPIRFFHNQVDAAEMFELRNTQNNLVKRHILW